MIRYFILSVIPFLYYAVGHAAPLPDFVVDAALAQSNIWYDWEEFAENSCEVIEGCVAKPGNRHLLHFYTRIINQGSANFELGDPSDPRNSSHFQWSPCHGHYHVKNWADYALVAASPQGHGEVVLTARKQAFCLMDSAQIFGSEPWHFSCGFQGISQGWADDYNDQLPCQWLDVTDFPAGNYKLRIQVNPENIYPESDTSNNTVEVSTSIP